MLKPLLPSRSFLLLQLLLLGEGCSSKVLMPSGNEDTKAGRKSRTKGGVERRKAMGKRLYGRNLEPDSGHYNDSKE